MKKLIQFIIVILGTASGSCADRPTEIGSKGTAIQGTHKVEKGEILNDIADGYRVERATMIYVNEAYLSAEYDNVCGGQTSRVRNNPRRNGLFCNDRYRKPYANTLVPGMVLKIPAPVAPEEIKKIVANSTGKRVALVVDESGSMGDDIATVTGMYSAALTDQDKKLVGIWVYADGKVRKIDPEGFVNFYNPNGEVENTFAALKAAAEDHPDTIILVTDEPGDDWVWPGWFFGSMNLPPVIATCLSDRGVFACESNLKRLVEETGGEYVAYKPRP